MLFINYILLFLAVEILVFSSTFSCRADFLHSHGAKIDKMSI